MDLVLRGISGMCVAPAHQELNLWHKTLLWNGCDHLMIPNSSPCFGSVFEEQGWAWGAHPAVTLFLVLTALLDFAGFFKAVQFTKSKQPGISEAGLPAHHLQP